MDTDSDNLLGNLRRESEMKISVGALRRARAAPRARGCVAPQLRYTSTRASPTLDLKVLPVPTCCHDDTSSRMVMTSCCESLSSLQLFSPCDIYNERKGRCPSVNIIRGTTSEHSWKQRIRHSL